MTDVYYLMLMFEVTYSLAQENIYPGKMIMKNL